MIFQGPRRHEARVREQIGYGDVAALHDMARIREAAKLGGADGFIGKLPEAFEAHLGLWELEAHTQKLSSGQWQRLALARHDAARVLIRGRSPTQSQPPPAFVQRPVIHGRVVGEREITSGKESSRAQTSCLGFLAW